MNRVLGLFAKLPHPGQVKTRLASETSPLWAAQVARAFLLDMLDRLTTIVARRILAFAPTDAEAAFAKLVQERFALQPQSNGDLGQRLEAFLLQQRAAGAEQVVVLGTDSPTVPLAFVERAFTELQRADVVLGPATDGGYYLLGCGCRWPPLFTGIRWGSHHVLADTLACLADTSWRLAVLPPWYDVDTLADWHMLQGHLAALRRAGHDPGLTHIAQVQAFSHSP